MAQQLEYFTLVEDWSLVPSSIIGWLTPSYNSSSRRCPLLTSSCTEGGRGREGEGEEEGEGGGTGRGREEERGKRKEVRNEKTHYVMKESLLLR